jgi:hypothetical protein
MGGSHTFIFFYYSSVFNSISFFFTQSFLSAVFFMLFQFLVATMGALLSSSCFIRYELAECTTAESLSPTLRPADPVTMLAVTSHFSRRHGGLYINSWSPRDFPSILTLSVSCLFHRFTMMHLVCIMLRPLVHR